MKDMCLYVNEATIYLYKRLSHRKYIYLNGLIIERVICNHIIVLL